MPAGIERTIAMVACSLQRSEQVAIRLELGWATLLNLHRLVAGEVDAMVVAGPVGDPKVTTRVIGWVDSVLYVDAAHPLAHRAAISLDILLEEPTFQRPEGVDEAWHDHWLMREARGGEPRYTHGPGADEYDVQRIIGTGRATGVAPSTWCRADGIVAVPIRGIPPSPVNVVTLADCSHPQLEAFVQQVHRAIHPKIRLTDAERRVVMLLAQGMSNLEIAAELTVSVRTVESHISSALRRTDHTSRTRLVAAWWRGDNATWA